MNRRISRLAGVIAGVTTLGILGLSSPAHANHPGEKRISQNNVRTQQLKLKPDLSNYIWNLSWNYKGVHYHGKLVMNDRGRGHLTVRYRDGRSHSRVVKQDVYVKNTRNDEIVLQGYNVNNRKHPYYAPDKFCFELGYRDNIRQIFHCSTHRNLYVSYDKIPRHRF